MAARSYIYNKIQQGKTHENGADVCTDINHCKAYISKEALIQKWGSNFDEYFKKISDCVKATEDMVIIYNGEIITDDINKSEEYAADLNTTFVENVITGKSTHLYKISTIARSGESYWSWLALLDTNVIIIMILLILVSCFT